jgi:hypothetical protein
VQPFDAASPEAVAVTRICEHLELLVTAEIRAGNRVFWCEQTRFGLVLTLRRPLRSPPGLVRAPLVESDSAEPGALGRELHCIEHRHRVISPV